MAYLSRLEGDRRAALPRDAELAAAFLPTRDEADRKRAETRDELVRDWPRVAAFVAGDAAFGPYTFLHRRHAQWLPTTEERRAALKQLPYLKSERFVHQRTDSRHPVTYTYVRRPRYYAAFNSGKKLTAQQRYGLGLLWSPATGALLQTQTATREAAWGTLPADGRQVYEATDLPAQFFTNDRAVEPKPGAGDLADGAFSVRYPLGPQGHKELNFGDVEIEVAIEHPGSFVEQIPLLVEPDDELRTSGERIELRRRDTLVLALAFDPAAHARIVETDTDVSTKRVRVVTIEAVDHLHYTLSPTGETPPPSSQAQGPSRRTVID
jgi:hypothetical protein